MSTILRNAADLLGPVDDESDPEYKRAIVELVSLELGIRKEDRPHLIGLLDAVRIQLNGEPRAARPSAATRLAAPIRCSACGGTGGQHFRNCPIYPH